MVSAFIKNAAVLLLILVSNTKIVDGSKKRGRGHHKHGKRGNRSDTSQDTSRENKESFDDSHDLPIVEEVKKKFVDPHKAEATDKTQVKTMQDMNGCYYSRKYTAKWPHCGNIECRSGSVNQLQLACDRHADCSGITFTAGTPSRGSGCLKKCGFYENANGYGKTTHDYWVKGICPECTRVVAGKYDKAGITQDKNGQLTVDMSVFDRPTATGKITSTDSMYITGSVKFPDDKEYDMYFNKLDQAIYWDGKKGFTTNIWTKDSCLAPDADSTSYLRKPKTAAEDVKKKKEAKQFEEHPVEKKAEEEGSCATVEEDYIYKQMALVGYPVMEYMRPPMLKATEKDCPEFLCSAKYDISRMVLFYYPDQEAREFRNHYRDFGKTLLNMVISSTNDHIQIYAVSCCGNAQICEDNKITQYPTFKLIKAGQTSQTAPSAVFSGEQLSGRGALNAVKGVYNMLYPDASP